MIQDLKRFLSTHAKLQPVEKSGHLASRSWFKRDAGQLTEKSGHPAKIETGGKPKLYAEVKCKLIVSIDFVVNVKNCNENVSD